MKSQLSSVSWITALTAFFCAVIFAPPLKGQTQNFEIAERVDPIIIVPPEPHPCPTLRAGNITEEVPHHDVKVFFPWWPGIADSSIADGNLIAIGPDGVVLRAKFVSIERLPVPFPLPLSTVPEGVGDTISIPQPGPVVVVTYRFCPPPRAIDDGLVNTWTSKDNGRYNVHLVRNQITTDDGSFLPGKFLGGFLCAIRDDPGVPIQPSSVRCTVKRHRLPVPDVRPDGTLDAVGYHALVQMCFPTPYVEIDWARVERNGNTFKVNATALRRPIPVPDITPIPIPLPGELQPIEADGTQRPLPEDPTRPEILPCFLNRYNLGHLAPGEYRFVFCVNGEVECADAFHVPPIPPIDDEPPGAELEVRNITAPFDGPQKMLVTYTDRSGVDVSTIGDGDLVVFSPCLFVDDPSISNVSPIPCNWRAQRARLVEIVSVSTHNRIVKASYEIDPPQGGWSEAHNGFYPVVLWEDAVCDRLGNCTERERLGGFEVAIDNNDPPIPARAEVKVDPSNPNRVKAKVHIKFGDYFQVTNQAIRRDGNRIYLIATAAPYSVPAIFPPPPFPEEDLCYDIGPLREGDYTAIFIMNGHVYDAERFHVRPTPPIKADVDLVIDSSDPDNVLAHVTIQFFSPHRVEQGDVERHGNRIILPAKARPLPILHAADSIRQDGSLVPGIQPPVIVPPRPFTLTYQIGALRPGGYLGVFVMNEFPYAAEDFKVGDPGPPIPAKVELTVNQDDRTNTVVIARIKFETPHVVVGRDIHRHGNRFILEAKAEPIRTLSNADAAGFAPVPVPQVVTVEYPLGDLEAGQYGAAFVMNGFNYEQVTWTERGGTFEADVAIDVQQTASGAWNAEVKILFANPRVRITDPGEVVFDGPIIKINATAEIPDITPVDPTDPAPGTAPPERAPIVLNYDLGNLRPGGHWLKYFINGSFEKQHDFVVPPTPPIPADVDLTVDTSSQPIIATACIQFRDHYRIKDTNVRRIGNVFILDATADGPLPILAPIPPPPTKVDYDLGELPRGFYLAAFRMNGHFYDFAPFWVRDQGFEAEVDLSVDVGNAGDDVLLKAVVDIDDPYVIVTDWGTPVISASGEIKINATAERVVFITEPSGDPMENVYNLGALRPGVYHVSFCLNGEPEARLRFRVPPPCESPANVSHIVIEQGDASWFSTVGVILVPGQEVTSWGVVRQSGDEFHVNITVECVDFPEPPVPLPRPIPFDPALPAGIEFDSAGNPLIGGFPVRLVTHTYNLGVLDQGCYKFFVHSLGQTVARKKFVVPGSPPRVEVSTGNITEATDEHRFGITYHDPTGLDHESIMNATIWIVSNTGYREQARLLSYASTDDDPSSSAAARYAVDGPGGSWDFHDNGKYWIVVDPTEIRDLQGNHIENPRLGCFYVRILPDPPEPGVNVSVAMNANGEWEATVEIISEPGQQVVVNDWETICLQFGHSIVKIADVEIEPTNGPVEPLAHVYNLGILQPGFYVFAFKTNLAHCGVASFTVPGEEGDPIDNWQVRLGLAAQADEGDGDGDGLNLVGEYFFVTDPDRADRPHVRPEIVTDAQGNRHLGLRFRRLHGAEGVNQIVEASSGLDRWDDVNDRIDVIEQNVNIDGTVEILLCLRDALEDSPYDYLRVRAVRDSN